MFRIALYIILFSTTISLTASAGDDADIKQALRQNTSLIYKQLDFSNCERLDYSVFAKAYTGYLMMMKEHQLNNSKRLLTVCDYSLSANKNRMWVIDIQNKKILINTLVAHGQGSGEEYATKFSNIPNSHQSSIGFYITGSTYTGKHGNSLYLYGMDKGYNSAAYDRSIVIHGAGYVSKDFILGTGRLGRSWGCPALSNEMSDKVIQLIKEGTCLFIYYPEKKYFADSHWLHYTNEAKDKL